MRVGLRPALAKRTPLLGLFISAPAPHLVELAGHLGYDWVFIDAEHGPMDLETCEHMVRAAETAGIVPLIRLPYPDPNLVNRYLDTGAMGILVPHFASAEIARTFVAAAKYHPLGQRGAGSRTRAGDFGLGRSATEYAAWANAETMLFGILEDQSVAGELDAMLALDGLDGFVVGPSDLAQSLGLPGQTKHPRVTALVDELTRRVLASPKLVCRPLQDAATAADEARTLARQGVPMLAEPYANLFTRGAKPMLETRANAQPH